MGKNMYSNLQEQGKREQGTLETYGVPGKWRTRL